MSIRASIAYGEKYHLFKEELLSEVPRFVYLELESPEFFEISKETYPDATVESLKLGIPSQVMDEIAIEWIKHRKLQGAVGGPVGNELGSPDNPWE